MIVDEAKVIPSQTQVQGQFRRHLPVVLKITAVVILSVIAERDIGGINIIRTTDIVNPTHGGSRRGKQELRAARVASAYVWNVGIVAVKIELRARPRWL